MESSPREEELEAAAQRLAKLLAEGAVDQADPGNLAHQVPVPSKAALLGLFMGAVYQQNQAARELSPVTSALEDQVIESYAAMLGLGQNAWGYLCSGGTSASLHALWTHSERAGEASVDLICSHATHVSVDRVAGALKGIRLQRLDCDAQERITVGPVEQAVRDSLSAGRLPVVVATCGTTGAGQIDPIAELVELRRKTPFVLHVDGAWGGFLPTLTATGRLGRHARDVAALAHVDSIGIDSHKMASMPVGCAVLLFRDPALREPVHRHSPYVFAEGRGHSYGQLSLTMSRNGMYAAAHWLQNQVRPLTAEGLGRDIEQILDGARTVAEEMQRAGMRLLFEPTVGIVVCAPKRTTMSETNAVVRQVAAECLWHDERPMPDLPTISTYLITAPAVLERISRETGVVGDTDELSAFRLVVASPPRPGFQSRAASAALALARHCGDPPMNR
ncbi:pyridoxal phosphate-dependent decarboxylase family protein [Streptomyces sp. NPDC058877]|uniref:pyridoxal phosphate-dependent decarboxylase family protein n=1 Tax=Streptomyces sp. NPDC058877 TaxID=3346665 RepID=UPI0036B8D399